MLRAGELQQDSVSLRVKRGELYALSDIAAELMRACHGSHGDLEQKREIQVISKEISKSRV